MVQRLRVPYAKDIKVTANGGGVELYDLTPSPMMNLYHGGQFTLFGRYRGSGESKLTLAANMGGEDKTIELNANFPALDASATEIQRMWACNRIQDHMRSINDGSASQSVTEEIIALGTAYSITSPYTSFLVLESEQMYRDFNVQRRNRDRIATERQAQASRDANPAPVGQQFRPMDNSANGGSPGQGVGGGAISPIGLLVMGGSVVAAMALRRRKHPVG
jgi:hypothetical protein